MSNPSEVANDVFHVACDNCQWLGTSEDIQFNSQGDPYCPKCESPSVSELLDEEVVISAANLRNESCLCGV